MPWRAELEEISGHQAGGLFGRGGRTRKREWAKGGNGKGEKWIEQHDRDVMPPNDLVRRRVAIGEFHTFVYESNYH